MQNTVPRVPQRHSPSGKWVFRPPQQQGAVRPPRPQLQQSGPRPNVQQPNCANSDNRCFTCGSPAHFARNCPRNQKPAQGQNLKQNKQGKGKKQVMQVRQGKINFTTLAELPKGAPIMMVHFLSIISLQLYCLILVQPIVLLVLNVGQD